MTFRHIQLVTERLGKYLLAQCHFNNNFDVYFNRNYIFLNFDTNFESLFKILFALGNFIIFIYLFCKRNLQCLGPLLQTFASI